MQRDSTSNQVAKESSRPALRRAGTDDATAFGPQLQPVWFLVVIFLLNFISRIILSPLLPTIERELGISHAQAGFLFFLTSGGYLGGLLSSGLLAAHTTHRFAIIVSGVGVGLAMLTVAFAGNLLLLGGALFGVGLTAGLYMPSAIATITSLVDRAHWGKAIAVHELAPNVAFFVSPFVAEFFLAISSWRTAMGVLGILSIAAGIGFARFGRGGEFAGESPFSAAFGSVVRTPSFWLMIILFGLGVSSTVGIYALLPLYLVTERAMETIWANTIVALSRIHGPIMGLLGGWATDKLGVTRTIIMSLAFTGLLTALLGLLSGVPLNLAVLLQPLVAVWFFPAAFAAIAMITPANARNLAVSLSVPFGFLIGGGAVPTFIGAMGDAGSFAWGITITGAMIAAGALLAGLLRLPTAPR